MIKHSESDIVFDHIRKRQEYFRSCFTSTAGYNPFHNASDHSLTPKLLEEVLGGNAAVWGRLLKGVGVPHGEYLMKVNLIKQCGFDIAVMQLDRITKPRKSKFRGTTRKGGIVPHFEFGEVPAFHGIDDIILYRQSSANPLKRRVY